MSIKYFKLEKIEEILDKIDQTKLDTFLENINNEDYNFTIVKNSDKIPSVNQLLEKILQKIWVDCKIYSHSNKKIVWCFSFYKKQTSNSKLYWALGKITTDLDFLNFNDYDHIIIEQIWNWNEEFLLVKSLNISLYATINTIIEKDLKQTWHVINNSSLIAKWFWLIYNEFLKKAKKTKKEDDIWIKKILATYPFSYNSKMYNFESYLREVSPDMKNAKIIKSIIKNSFINNITIWNKKINFSVWNDKTVAKKFYDSYKELVDENSKSIDFIKKLINFKVSDNPNNVLTDVFLPNEDHLEKDNPLTLNKTSNSEDDINYFIKDNFDTKYYILDVNLWYSKLSKKEIAVLSIDWKIAKKTLYEEYNKNINIPLIKIIDTTLKNINKSKVYEIYDNNIDESSYEEIEDKDTKKSNDITKAIFNDLYILCKKEKDNSIYCIKYESKNKYIIYKYTSELKLSEKLDFNSYEPIKNYCEIFLDDVTIIKKIWELSTNSETQKNFLSNKIKWDITNITTTEDRMSYALSNLKNQKENNYIFSGKCNKDSEIADMIYYKENSDYIDLKLFHFKTTPFDFKYYNSAPWYWNINSVIWEMLQKTFFIHKNKSNFWLNFTWKDKIKDFIQKEKNKNFTLYNNEKLNNLFNLKIDNQKSPIKIWETEKNNDTRLSVWIQYYYIKNILNFDINNFSYDKWNIITELKTLLIINKVLVKDIFWEKSPEYEKMKEKDDNYEIMIEFNIWKYINEKLT